MGRWHQTWDEFAGTPARAIGSLILLAAFTWLGWTAIDWAILDAVWLTDDPSVCDDAGACWAVVAEKHRPMFAAAYPYEEQWRVALAIAIAVGATALSLWPRVWRWWVLLPLWVISLPTVLILLFGGVLGLNYVSTAKWGGLALTVCLFLITVVIGMPIATALALARHEGQRYVRLCATIVVEAIRAVPLVLHLFAAIYILPLALPGAIPFNKLGLAAVALAVYFAAYEAEVIRAGLAAIPEGQRDAAKALGLSYARLMWLVVLPQAFRVCLPGITNHMISALKNTSFVIIIGLLDMLNATNSALQDPIWRRFTIEALLAVGLVYFVLCFALSRYSRYLERRLTPATP